MKDKCVVCKKDSHHNKDEHIKVRIGYIEGSGQLCLNCYDDIYSIKKAEVKMIIKIVVPYATESSSQSCRYMRFDNE